MLSDIQAFLDTILGKPESELVEFKQASKQFNERELWNYFSALSNEANLNSRASAYLILGIHPKTHLPEWTQAWSWSSDLRGLKNQTHKDLGIGFREIYETTCDKKRVLIFEIPSAPQGAPIASNGFYYARAWESLIAMDLRKLDEIRNQILYTDWSAELVSNASINDLDPNAILLARENFKQKHSKIPSSEIDSWSDQEFLNRAKLTKGGNITRTTLILLGKSESTHFLSPCVARITWVLKDANGREKDYEHFDPPFLLAVDMIYAKIRNLRYRYMQEGTLFPEEVDMYDPWVIRELLHNCIAHEDYARHAKITLVEFEDGRLIFENAGTFIPGSIEQLIKDETPPKVYRNPYLSDAMAEINMIDTIGSGVKRVFQKQKERFFPMPTYSFMDDEVSVELFGKILDTRYANLLAKHTNLSLVEIIALDKIQKGKGQEIEKTGVDSLKKKWLVEGRYPNIYLSESVHEKIGKKDTYIKTRWFDDQYYCDMITDYVTRYGEASKKDIRNLLLGKLPDILSESQKEWKVSNLITKLAKIRSIEAVSGKTNAKKDRIWKLIKN